MSDQHPDDILYFCDESSQVGDEFMAVAGLAVRRARIAAIVADLNEINTDNGIISEVKWTTAKRRRVSVHILYADYLFRLLAAGHAHFHIRFAPFGEYDHRRSGDRGRVDTVSKMYYQLLLHRAAGFYGGKAPIYVHPDAGDCTALLPLMRNQLCAAAWKHKNCKPNCVRVIEPRDSSREPMLQLLDVTLGALTARRNNRVVQDTKAALIKHVMGLTKWPKLEESTPKDIRRFNVWNVVPSG